MSANGMARHPGKLPSHLDLELYIDFLSMQTSVLTSMEEYILRASTEKQALTELRRAFHTLKGESGFFRLDAVESLCHSAEDVLDKDAFTENAIDLFLDIQSWLRRSFDWYAGKPVSPPENPEKLLQRLRNLEETPSVANRILGDQQQENSRLVHENVLVEATRLDRLMDTIGELVIVETMVHQSPELMHIKSGTLHTHLTQLRKLTRELQNLGLTLRMVPIRPLFMKMERMVRELGVTLNKSVAFQTLGSETELDRSLVEHLRDPLLHLIRNAMDHGIESPDVRKKKGKPEKGLILMEARHRGGDIHISIRDDGQGFDHLSIARKAREQGLISHDNPLSTKEIQEIIFQPGFSTAVTLTEISGRGVGLDVVREKIQNLSGDIRLESESHTGSAFHLRIPMTVAIIDGIVCRCDKKRYVLPTLSVLGSLEVFPEQLCTLPSGMCMTPFHGHLLPVAPLEALLQGKPLSRKGKLMLVIEGDGSRAGILVEEILGKQQIVIKPLGEVFSGIRGISGATIMPDGEVGLILDPQALIRMAFRESESEKALDSFPLRG